jgi:hypothetical protein
MKLKTITIQPRKMWYHGTDRLPVDGVEWCSYFGGKAATADRYISQPGRSGRIQALWIIPARVKQPTVFLDVTGGKPRLGGLVGPLWFRRALKPYLRGRGACEAGAYCDYQYAEAFCRAQEDGLFPGVAGFYRGPLWGLVVVNPDEVMDYGAPRPARRAGW